MMEKFLKSRFLEVILMSVWLGIPNLTQGQNLSINQRSEVNTALDEFLIKATNAADAANVVKEAEERRQAAAISLKAGRRIEAIKLLRQAGEFIAMSIPEEDIKRNDPFLRDYLHELAVEINAIDDTVLLSKSVNNLDITNPKILAFLN